MNKYIPADKLITALEKRMEETKSMKPAFDQFWAGQISAFKGAVDIAKSLQQEQSKLPGYDKALLEVKSKIGDTIYFNSFGKIVSMVVDNIIDTGDGNPMYEDADGSCVFEKDIIEQKPSESDTIKGGDFISDGKRVFLVLANVKERNLGETSSTFCEGRILGVDGVVYCDGDDFKEFKRATSDERAKFIHDLKVGVELKEHPAEWSDEDEKCIKDIINCLEYLKREDTERQYNGDRSVNPGRYEDMIAKLKSFRPHPHWKPIEEQMKHLERCFSHGHTSQLPNQHVLESLYNDLKKLL